MFAFFIYIFCVSCVFVKRRKKNHHLGKYKIELTMYLAGDIEICLNNGGVFDLLVFSYRHQSLI